jgi:hypothetical protein
MIYLASPYTHPDPFVREARYLAACQMVAEYLKKARWVYSPIVHCHELAKMIELPREFSFWKQYNQHMLSRSEALHVLMIDGWAESDGIGDEISFWSSLNPGNKWQKAQV